jgi:uncharacterized protein
MQHCHCYEAPPEHLVHILGLDMHGPMLIVTIFVTGLAASFSHCIGMCGPIALNQMNMRLMNLSPAEMSEWNKVYCAFSIPYYLGKTITYVLLMSVTYFISASAKSFPLFNIMAIALLSIMAMLFISAGMERTLGLFKVTLPFKSSINRWFMNITGRYSLNYNGWPGLVMGMVLGMIPCGVVYAIIGSVVANSSNYLIAFLAMLSFGLATVPGLFLIALFGESLMSRYQRLFQIVYGIMMWLNAYILLEHIFMIYSTISI